MHSVVKDDIWGRDSRMRKFHRIWDFYSGENLDLVHFIEVYKVLDVQAPDVTQSSSSETRGSGVPRVQQILLRRERMGIWGW